MALTQKQLIEAAQIQIDIIDNFDDSILVAGLKTEAMLIRSYLTSYIEGLEELGEQDGDKKTE